MIDPSPAASPADEEEYPQADGRRCKANDQKDTSNSTLVVEEPITKRNSISYVMHHGFRGLTGWCLHGHRHLASDSQLPR